jgi:DNA-directed RNA polymerase subunit M/transcription elongation factor TFIIS
MVDRFDAHGVGPGLANQKEAEPKVIHLKCPNSRCKSVRAIQITPQPTNETQGAPHNRTYQCVECKYVWGVSTGGYAAF